MCRLLQDKRDSIKTFFRELLWLGMETIGSKRLHARAQ